MKNILSAFLLFTVLASSCSKNTDNSQPTPTPVPDKFVYTRPSKNISADSLVRIQLKVVNSLAVAKNVANPVKNATSGTVKATDYGFFTYEQTVAVDSLAQLELYNIKKGLTASNWVVGKNYLNEDNAALRYTFDKVDVNTYKQFVILYYLPATGELKNRAYFQSEVYTPPNNKKTLNVIEYK